MRDILNEVGYKLGNDMDRVIFSPNLILTLITSKFVAIDFDHCNFECVKIFGIEANLFFKACF
jgi:hypothetical protein